MRTIIEIIVLIFLLTMLSFQIEILKIKQETIEVCEKNYWELREAYDKNVPGGYQYPFPAEKK